MLKKIVVAASCVLLVMAAGCKKEEAPPASVPPRAKSICVPSRTVLGSDLIAELNALANCGNPTGCVRPTTTTVQSGTFTNPATILGYHDSNTITTAEQSGLLSDAQSFAAANTPAGYHILSYEFKALYSNIVFYRGWFNVYVIVTYRKCGSL